MISMGDRGYRAEETIRKEYPSRFFIDKDHAIRSGWLPLNLQRYNLPKEAMCFTINTGSEEEFVVSTCIRIVTELQGPQTINRNWSVCLVSELAKKLASIQIIRIDATVAEIADQQGITEQPKIGGGVGQAPGRVEPAVHNETLNQISTGVEDVDKPMGRTR